MSTQYTASIQTLYVAYFNRPADPSGLAFWEGVVAKANGNTTAVSAEFAKSAEYKAAYAGLSDDAVINQVYMNIFGRQVDSQGLNFWSPKLTAKLVTIDQIVTEVAKGAQGSDATTYNNRVTASVAYTEALNADVNLRLAYSNAAAITSAKAFLNGITTDASLTAAIAPAALAANLAQMVIDAAPVGPTFTLTSGFDTFVGTTANDTFNSSNTNLGVLDSINGGAGNDTLNVIDSAAALTPFTLSTLATVKSIEVVNVTSVSNSVTADTTSFAGVNKVNVSAVGGASLTSAATTIVNETVAAVAAGTVASTGGSDVSVVANGVTNGGAINVTGAAGNVKVIAADTLAAGTAAGSAITVNGGKTISVTETAAHTNLTGATLTQGAINVTGDVTTTSVTVVEASKVSAVTAVTAVAAVKEVFTATFIGAEAAGNTIGFDGVTYTVAGGGTASATATATAFVAAYNATAGATWVAVDNGAGTVTFTKKTAVAVADTVNADFTGTGSHPTAAAPSTQGVTAVTGVTGVAGIDQGTVTIADKTATSLTAAGTISTVSLSGYGAGSTIASNALTSLTLANSLNGVTVTDALTTPTATTLALNVNGLKAGASLTDNTIKTLNITASGASSSMAVSGTALRTVSVAGDKAITLGTIVGVTAFTSTNTAGVTATVNAASTASFGDGADVVTVAAGATKAISLGAGNDKVIVTTLGAGGTLDGGIGINTLSLDAGAAATASLSNTFAAAVTGFQILELTGATNQTIDVAVMGAYSTISTAGGNGLILNNTASGATLQLTGAGTSYIVNQTNALAGSADVLNVALTSSASAGFGTVQADNVETIKIVTTDKSTAADGSLADTLTLASSNTVKAITVGGNAHLTLTAPSTALTSFDASGFSGTGAGAAATGVSWTSGALANVATIIGSASGGDVLDASLATKAVTITTIAGTNTITGSSTIGSTLIGGAGNDTIIGGAGIDTIVTGGGTDRVNGGAGADLITLSGVKETLVQVAGSSGTNTATTIQTSELTSTFDIVKGFAAGDKIDLSGISPAYATANLTMAGTNLASADNAIVFTSGTYDAAAGTFTFAANGLDTAVTYDANAAVGTVAGETIILVGYHAATTSTAALGIITLA